MTQHRYTRSSAALAFRDQRLSRRAFAASSAAAAVATAGLVLGGRFAAPAAAQAAPTKVSLALDWYPTSQHAGIYVAQAKGYFTEAGLEVNVYTPA
ncbi:MAG TPA: ABC transporter substrate-binding protein, partial [Thermomicrobiales bacterium]|nr:ABC transporter substrate-binding protein [Thermomicrobiales bacterium]